MRILTVTLLFATLAAGCHFQDFKDAATTADPRTGETPTATIIKGVAVAVSDPFNLNNLLEIGAAVTTLVVAGFGLKKAAAAHAESVTTNQTLATVLAPDETPKA